jgi:O-antigen ligase
MTERNSWADANQRIAAIVRNLVLFVVLLHLFMFKLDSLFADPTESEMVTDVTSDAGNLYNQLLLPVLFFTVCILVRTYRVPGRALFAAMIPAAPMLLLIALSTLWSEYPELTIRRAFHEIIEVTTLTLLASCFSNATEIFKVFFRTFLAIACLDLLSAAIFSNVFTSIGFAGIHGHKNLAGQFFVVALPVYLLGTLHREISGNRFIGLLALLSCIAMLILSDSKTSIGAAIFGFASVLITRGLSHRDLAARVPYLVASALGLLCAIATLTIWTPNELLETLVGDPTLTGRDSVWQYAMNKFDESPVLGAGYGAIWQIGLSIQTALKEVGVFIVFNEAHNGYLDLAAQVGIVGIPCLLAYLVITLINTLSYWDKIDKHTFDGVGAFTIYIFWALILSNVSESLYFQAGLGFPDMLMFLAPFAASQLAIRGRAGSRYMFVAPGAGQPQRN